MHINKLKEESPLADACRLKEALHGIKDRRGKIARMLKAGELTSLRRGLYALRHDVNPMGVAGAIYGPSYVSFECALSWHGLIPERVEAITSASLKRSALFQNPLGTFPYWHVPPAVYAVGIMLVRDDELPFLIASPTKAICDRIVREGGMRSMKEVLQWVRGMRIEEPVRLDQAELLACAENYGRPAVRWLARAAEKYNWVAE